MRKKWVIGNWKMNANAAFVNDWAHAAQAQDPTVSVAVCPPFPYIVMARQQLAGSAIEVGAQNVAATEEGAFTGEVAATMLKDVGAALVLVGHSERRTLYGETNEQVAEKCLRLQEQGLLPVVCVGETQAEREQGITEQVVAEQLAPIVELIKGGLRPIIAYEPVWAIGTGLTATPEQAQAVHQFIRESLAKISLEVAQSISILYGGSVNRDNAAALFSQADIDGGLIGGASLDVEHFFTICKALSSH